MLLGQEFRLFWASLELFLAVTHLYVLLGLRNSSLTFLRTQKNYFLLDAITHITNLILNYRSMNSISMVLLMLLWSFMFVGHINYFLNLHRNPPLSNRQRLREPEKEFHDVHKISRIFHWSCIEFQANRFSIYESGKEMLETTGDIVAHTSGFYLVFLGINSMTYRCITIILMIAFLYRQMLNLRYFIKDPKMMPPVLRKLNDLVAGKSSVPTTVTE